MKIITGIKFFIILIMFFFNSSVYSSDSSENAGASFLIMPKTSLETKGMNPLLDVLGKISFKKLNNGLLLLNNLTPTLAKNLIAELKKRGLIEYGEPDYKLTLMPYQVGTAGLPSDSFSEMEKKWDLLKIEADKAWELSQGDESILVAVLDSGVDIEHPDLKNNIWTNEDEIPGNGIDDDENGYIDDYRGYNFCDKNANPRDTIGHGTHTSGIIAAEKNSLGSVGIAPKVKIMPVKIFGCKNGTMSTAIEAIHYAVDNGAVILSNSWGIEPKIKGDVWGGATPLSLKAAIDYANSKGVIFVAASGNFSDDNDAEPMYPAGYDSENIISVTASDSNDNLVMEGQTEKGKIFQVIPNFGKNTVHIAAPGNNIFSLWKDAGYKVNSGTSMAAPLVSGLAALILSLDPNLSPKEVIERIINSVDVSEAFKNKILSEGRINARRALTKEFNNSAISLPFFKDTSVFWVEPGCSQAHFSGEEVTVEGFIRGIPVESLTSWKITEKPANYPGEVQILEKKGTVMKFIPAVKGDYSLEFCSGRDEKELKCKKIFIVVVSPKEELPDIPCRYQLKEEESKIGCFMINSSWININVLLLLLLTSVLALLRKKS